MAEVKKNITVCARVRPIVEGDDGGADALTVSGSRVLLNEKGQQRPFDVDAAYDRSASNMQLFEGQIEPLVQRVLGGYNAFVLAYGAGRTGKSYTLFGGPDSAGIVDASCDSLFHRLESQLSNQKAFVTVSVFDVYNSLIVDLLHPNTKTGLNLLDHRSFGCVVEDLGELEAVSANEAKSYIKQAMAVHDALELRMTNQLGKPHTFIDVRVEMVDKDNPATIKFATLRFCSPAGCGGVSLKFNAGLQSLNKVVESLAAEKEAWNIPYASSRLTRLLEPGLGGNSFALWITTLDSSDRSASDSLHALDVGDKIRRVRNAARVNKNTIQSTIRELREEIKKARGKLQLTQPGTYMHDIDPQQIRNLKQLIAELERVKANTWDKKRERSAAVNASRRAALESEGLLYTLTEAKDVDLPEQMKLQARTMLTAIVAQKAMCDDSEAEVDEKRNLFKMRLESVQKKAAASGQAGGSVADLTKSDEKLLRLEKGLLESEDKLRMNQVDLQKLEDEYRKLLTKMATIESKQRKQFLLGRDAAGLERLNRANEWATMKKDMEADGKLAEVVQRIAQNTEGQKQQLQGTSDPAQLQDAALRTLESLRETTENSARLEWERDALWGRLIESQFKHEVQMNRYQEHMFFIFRNYRSHFEEQKDRMEARYRDLLENSVKDALKLSEENQKLRAQLDARLKQI